MKLFRLVSSILFAIAAPALATVTVTSPKASSTVTSPVQYTATATASTCSKGVATMGIYVNNKLIYTVAGSKLSTSVTLATGAEHTVVQEWDKCGTSTYTTVNLTVVTSFKPTVTISANPTSVKTGASSTLTVAATNATKVVLSGTDGSSYTFATKGGTHAVTPKATTTYTVTATGSGGVTATAKTTVTVTAPAPTATITATPTTVKAGVSSTLKVTATNAATVTITGSNGHSYSLSATGGSEVVSPTSTTIYTATATSSTGVAVTAKVTVTVTAPPAPTATITATPTTVKAGVSSTLKVTATNAATVVITGNNGTSYSLSATGGSQSVSPAATTIYTVTATSSTGVTVTATVTVTVTAAPAPTATITATPTTIQSGASSSLKVTATNAATVMIAGNNGTSYSLSATGGSQSVSPSATTIYTVTATSSAGAAVTAQATVTVTAPAAPTVNISANPTSIALGNSSKLTVTASNATAPVTVAGDDGSSYTLTTTGGTAMVTPTKTTTYTATATGAGGVTALNNVQVTVGAKALSSIAISPNAPSFALGDSQTFTALATYSDNSTMDVTATANWSVANNAVATISTGGQATSVASGSTTVTAALSGISGSTPITVTIAPGTAVSIPTWHGDTYRSGLNNGEQSLSTDNVNSQNFGKLFTYKFNGYAYAQPLLISGVTINGTVHNVLYVATETNDVYAYDADTSGTGGGLLWHTAGATPDSVVSSSSIYPTIGITGTPVIDTTSNTMYFVSKQTASNGTFFWLNALDITTGAQKFGGPVKISASVPTTETSEFPSGNQPLTTSCIQRTALLEAYGNVYFGFGSCHSGFMLAYDTQTLKQTGIFNSSPNMDGEGQWASAGGVWMGGGGPASNGDGNVYLTTGNGPWDGQTAYSDSILQFVPPTLNSSSPAILEPSSWFTPQDYQYMDCSDGDMASGGLLLIPGTTDALAGAKTARMYLVNTTNLGSPTLAANNLPNDSTMALDTLLFESDLSPAKSATCTDTTESYGTLGHTIQKSQYEIYSTAAYFNGSIYMGITAETSNIPAGLRQFILSGNTLTPSTYTADGTEQEIRGTTPFISANGNSDGVIWMIDQNEPLGATGGYSPGIAVLRAYDPNDLKNELYNSNKTPGDQPGYGIKFTSPIVANGKVYIATGTTLEGAAAGQTGQIDVYGLN